MAARALYELQSFLRKRFGSVQQAFPGKQVRAGEFARQLVAWKLSPTLAAAEQLFHTLDVRRQGFLAVSELAGDSRKEDPAHLLGGVIAELSRVEEEMLRIDAQNADLRAELRDLTDEARSAAASAAALEESSTEADEEPEDPEEERARRLEVVRKEHEQVLRRLVVEEALRDDLRAAAQASERARAQHASSEQQLQDQLEHLRWQYGDLSDSLRQARASHEDLAGSVDAARRGHGPVCTQPLEDAASEVAQLKADLRGAQDVLACVRQAAANAEARVKAAMPASGGGVGLWRLDPVLPASVALKANQYSRQGW